MKPIIIKELIKSIKEEKRQALRDCWKYHKELIEVEGPSPKTKKSELLNFLYDLSLGDWEDVGFFVGYLRGLDWLEEQLSER